jgi:predicted nuclease of predicted toxin-antitoxin system
VRGKLRFLADENIARSTAEMLRREGFSVSRAQDVGLRGKPDDAILRCAARRRSVVLTLDKDFGGLLQQSDFECRVVLLRLADERPASINGRLKEILPLLAKALKDYRLAVVSESHVRLRK